MTATVNAVSQAEFARLIGVGRSHITALKKANRLVIDAGGKVLVEESKHRIEETKGFPRDDVKERLDEIKVRARQPEKTDNQSKKSEAVAREAVAKADMAEMDRDKMRGLLIERLSVDRAIDDVSSVFRQALENMPHRTAPELVGKDLNAIRATLKQEIHGALAEMEREFTKRLNQMGSEE